MNIKRFAAHSENEIFPRYLIINQRSMISVFESFFLKFYKYKKKPEYL